MAQLMPLPLTVSCFSKIQIVFFPFWYRLTRVVPEKGPLNGCVYVYDAAAAVQLAGPTAPVLGRSSFRRRRRPASAAAAAVQLIGQPHRRRRRRRPRPAAHGGQLRRGG